MNKEKSCGCIVLRDKKVLLIGAKDDNGELFWSFPKGHQEDGETDVETAIRETKEETNLDVKIVDDEPIKTGHLVHGGTAYKEILLFVAKPLNDEIKKQEDEVEKAKWVQINKASKYFDDYYSDAWKELLYRIKNTPY
ncbi:NUDIX hydrolase [Candidatus Saccharibacteria bacterium]|nr:NUDIX hydrolase [Candidatus Saccharibacteria bacterium]